MAVIEPFGQLLAGLLYRLRTELVGMVPPDNIMPGWIDDELISDLREDVPGSNPRIVVGLGATTYTSLPPGGGAKYSISDVLPGSGGEPSTVTAMTETIRLQTQVTIYVVAGGESGKYIRSTVAQAVKRALSTQRPNSGRRLDYIYLRIPDSLDAATPISAYDPAKDVFGLTATLILKSERMDDTLDMHNIFRQDITYVAYHSEYDAYGLPVVERVGVSVVIVQGT